MIPFECQMVRHDFFLLSPKFFKKDLKKIF